MKFIVEDKSDGAVSYWEFSMLDFAAETLVSGDEVVEGWSSSRAIVRRLAERPKRLGREVSPGMFLLDPEEPR